MRDEITSKIKIFVGYYKEAPVYHSNIFQPILTSDLLWDNPYVIKDNTGDNIANKHKQYAELTGHYWVWKNYLKESKEDYVGFCHYRRFLDFNLTSDNTYPFFPIDANYFDKIFAQNYTEENILNKIKDYDIVVPYKFTTQYKDILDQYLVFHPINEISNAINTIKDLFPDYLLHTLKFLGGKQFYTCLHFIMKKELLEEYFEWIFSFLDALEKQSDWSEYSSYVGVRTPAFIAERFFNVWVAMKTHNNPNLKVLETSSYILSGKDYGPTVLDYAKENTDKIN